MLTRKPHPDQLALGFSSEEEEELEEIIEARVAARAEAEALRWRFRLIVIESLMLSSLVLAAGITLEQPIWLVLRGTVYVGGGCFLTGLMLIGLTGATGRLLAWWRRRP